MENAAKDPHSSELADALMYLPQNPLVTYQKGQIIFDERHPPAGIHMVVEGRVKVTVNLDDGSETIIDIFGAGDFLGESSLLGSLQHSPRARALDDVSLMSWTTSEIEEQAERQPKLAIALVQMLVKRGLDYQARLQSFALDKTPERVVRSLLGFAERMGTRNDDGSIGIPPLTHQIIAQYVGTTREIISFQMNQLRHRGLLTYSRKGIQIDANALREYLRLLANSGTGTPPPVPQPSTAAELRL
jgi:CRP/FNR family transcriptional regulator, cyclic AMP receptor protein